MEVFRKKKKKKKKKKRQKQNQKTNVDPIFGKKNHFFPNMYQHVYVLYERC